MMQLHREAERLLSSSDRWLDEHPRTFLILRLFAAVIGGLCVAGSIVLMCLIAVGIGGSLIIGGIAARLAPHDVDVDAVIALVLPLSILGVLLGLWLSYQVLLRRKVIAAERDRRSRQEIARQSVRQAIVAQHLGCEVFDIRCELLGGGGVHYAVPWSLADAHATSLRNRGICLALAIVALEDDDGRVIGATDGDIDEIARLIERSVVHAHLRPGDAFGPVSIQAALGEARRAIEDALCDVPQDLLLSLEKELLRGAWICGDRLRRRLAKGQVDAHVEDLLQEQVTS